MAQNTPVKKSVMAQKSPSTPLRDRHPERMICILGDPGTSEETVGAVQGYLRNSSRIQIHVEYCTRERFTALSLRSTSIDSKYVKTFKELESSIMTLNETARRLRLWLWDNIEIHANSNGMSDAPSCSVASRIMKRNPELGIRTPAEVAFPRPGAFEIIVFSQCLSLPSKWKETVIYSKLWSKRWPDISQFSRFIEVLIVGGECVPSALVLQRAIRAHNARKTMSILWKSISATTLQRAYRNFRIKLAFR
jgi:hypothetical protein